MSDEPQAENAHNGTAPHPRLSGAPGWLAAALANPAQTIALLGVLLLGGAEGVDMMRGNDAAAPIDIEAEIARRAIAEDQAAQVRQAAADARACSDAVRDLTEKIEGQSDDALARSDELFAFAGEIAQYLERLAGKLTKKPPETGPRLDEYTRKALMRGYRTDEDR